MTRKSKRRNGWRPVEGALAFACAAAAPSAAFAFQFNMPSDWQVSWNNTATYNIGVRAHSIDPLIGNNPSFDESDYKFSHAGDLVTNRVSLLSELNVSYQDRMGFRLSASAWKDFAYGSGVNTNPGGYAPAGGGLPGIPYQATTSYPGGKYSSYTDRYYVQGAQLMDAFVYDNFQVGGKPIYFKLGQFTEYWGSAIFFPFQGISYSQGAFDGIKAAAVPGTQAKELFLPRRQLSLTAQITPDIALSGQYAFGFDRNRLPEGGTYLGVLDPLFQGPSNFFLASVPSAALGLPAGGYVPINVPAGASPTPRNLDNNFGIKMAWTPSFLNGGMGFYYRRFDETEPWDPLFNYGPNGVPSSYHMAYNRGVQLLGLSLDTTIGNVSAGFEASYRQNTALHSMPNALVPVENEGAKGDMLNLIANAIVPLSRSSLWDTGSLLAEVTYSRLLKVTANPLLYDGVGYAGCSTGNKWDNCSTKDYLALALVFEPQWLQVFPGVDLSMPISDVIGLYGNASGVGTAQISPQGSQTYSIGVKAVIRTSTTVTLAYNGSFAHTNGIAQTPSGLPYYVSGDGNFGGNDRNWVSLTVQSSF